MADNPGHARTTPAAGRGDASIARSEVAGLILAGGRSRRFAGRDKAFIPVDGVPMIEHLIRRLAPQVGELLINSNASRARFEHYALDVIADTEPGFQGPLAGLLAGLAARPGKYILAVSVDVPFIPPDLGPRLRSAIDERHCAYASDGVRHAPAILCPPTLADDIRAFLHSGGRRLGDWLSACGRPVIIAPSTHADITLNINTPDDVAAAEAFLHRRR